MRCQPGRPRPSQAPWSIAQSLARTKRRVPRSVYKAHPLRARELIITSTSTSHSLPPQPQLFHSTSPSANTPTTMGTHKRRPPGAHSYGRQTSQSIAISPETTLTYVAPPSPSPSRSALTPPVRTVPIITPIVVHHPLPRVACPILGPPLVTPPAAASKHLRRHLPPSAARGAEGPKAGGACRSPLETLRDTAACPASRRCRRGTRDAGDMRARHWAQSYAPGREGGTWMDRRRWRAARGLRVGTKQWPSTNRWQSPRYVVFVARARWGVLTRAV